MNTDTEKGITTFSIDSKPVVVYRHGDDVDLPHFFPWNSPSGRNMTIDITGPFPHHRAFWVSENNVILEGAEMKKPFANYSALYSGVKKTGEQWQSAPFTQRSKHVSFSNQKSSANIFDVDETILWLCDETKIADELRHYRFTALDNGEYFIDFSFKIVAAYGKLTVKCDLTHYAYPYIRMNKMFNVENGKGTITNSEGAVGQGATDQKEAFWVDYSAPTPDGGAEGLSCFLHPSQKPPHRWLTRNYGTWGPRRENSQHNTTFEIPKGNFINQRVGLLIHRGDVKTGNVAERYKAYCDGKL
ncbi:MAG: PmoA family protein [Planctomycetaceae bacterium]|nr:PmoA family protein [Planctomycetaceae bacterium]